MVEEPYTTRVARLHIRHVRDLIKSLDSSDAMNGLNGASISYLNTITEGEIDPNNENDFKEPKYVQQTADPEFCPLFPDKNDAYKQSLKRLVFNSYILENYPNLLMFTKSSNKCGVFLKFFSIFCFFF